MRKLALLLAAALVVSAPLVAATSTFTYAAEKKDKKASGKKEKKAKSAKSSKGAKAGKSAKADAPKADPNTAFFRALGDQMSGPPPGDAGKGKDKGKAKKSKKS
jgi:hypothetical protein